MAFETVQWGKGRKEAFRMWIDTEIFQTLGDRAQLERKWLNLITQYRATVVGDGTIDIPIIGSSDLEFPLTAIHFEPVYAELMQTLHLPSEFWTVSPLRDDMVPVAKPFQEFLSLVERRSLNMRMVNKRAFIDLIILGTCVYKDYIHHDARTFRDYDDSGAIISKRKLDFHPRVEAIPLQDFFIPAYASSINPNFVGGAPWVSHRFELTEGQFRQKAKAEAPFLPEYDPAGVANVLRYIDSTREDKVQELHRQEDKYQPFQDRKVRLHEVWARFDTGGDNTDEDVVAVWHQESGTLLRSTHNPFLHGDRPFHGANYIPSVGFYGIGLGEADEWAQLGMTRLLNNAITNTLIANQRMYSGPLGANISPDEGIYGGKYWPMAQGEQLSEVRLGEVYPSMFNMMDKVMGWSEQRTSVSDLRQGNMSSMPDRTPAATTMTMLQESGQKFDMVLSNLRQDALAGIGDHVVQNLIQISKTDPRFKILASQALGAKDGAAVSRVLSGPIHDVKEKLGIAVTATSSQSNKEVEKQSFVALMQIAAQTYPALVQYAQAMMQTGGDPNILGNTIRAAYTGQVELLQRVLETFNIRNPEAFVPEVPQQTAPQQPALGTPGMPGANGAGAPATAPLGGPGGPGPFAQGGPTFGSNFGL